MIGGGDPDCRRPMIWDSLLQDRSLLTYYKKLIEIRKGNSALKSERIKPFKSYGACNFLS